MNVQSEDIISKKQAILDSALELIRENGFHGTPMSLIAKKAGVAAGTIYHYFESKDELILELYVMIRSKMLDAMFNPAFEDKDFKSQFFLGWTSLCRYFISNPSCLIFIEQFSNSPYAKAGGECRNSPFLERFDAFFESGMEAGIIKQMGRGLIASISNGCIVATSKFHISGRFDFNDEDLCRIASIIWDGIKAHD